MRIVTRNHPRPRRRAARRALCRIRSPIAALRQPKRKLLTLGARLASWPLKPAGFTPTCCIARNSTCSPTCTTASPSINVLEAHIELARLNAGIFGLIYIDLE